jgi:non-ribosomal peptide synthetase component F
MCMSMLFCAVCRPGEKMYDTGDRCRYLPSGSIEVIGRCDFMVKIRGYSVVIGAVEVSAVLLLLAVVRQHLS